MKLGQQKYRRQGDKLALNVALRVSISIDLISKWK